MRTGHLYLVLAVPLAIILTMVFIDTMKVQNAVIERKEMHTKANAITRKPYVVRYYEDMICADRIEHNGRGMAYIEEYCRGGMFVGVWPPDSLKTEVHYEMESVVDSLAKLKGYGVGDDYKF